MIKVGDKVRLINKRGNCWNQAGKMDKYLGKVVVVSYIHDFGEGGYLFEIEGDTRWIFSDEDIVEIISDKKKSIVPGLRKEHNKLTNKVNKLKEFMISDRYKLLTEEQQDLLQFQYGGMVIYQKALRMRIDNLENEKRT